MSLFRRSSSPDPEPLRALCYGKLPVAKDFLKSRGGEASRGFQAWLNRLDAGQPATLPCTQRFLIAPPGDESYVAGTVWDSCDENCVRKFPFALYLEPPRAVLQDVQAHPFAAHLAAWTALENEFEQLSAAARMEDFYARLRAIRLEPQDVAGRDRFVDEAGGISARTLARSLFAEEPQENWIRLAWRLCAALGPPGQSSAAGTVALKLPLGTGIAYHLQVEAWLGLIRDRTGDRLRVPSVIFPRDASSDPGFFTLFFRNLRESDVTLLRNETGGADIVDLVSPPDALDVEGFASFHRSTSEWLKRPEATLDKLLPATALGTEQET